MVFSLSPLSTFQALLNSPYFKIDYNYYLKYVQFQLLLMINTLIIEEPNLLLNQVPSDSISYENLYIINKNVNTD